MKRIGQTRGGVTLAMTRYIRRSAGFFQKLKSKDLPPMREIAGARSV